MAASQCRSNGYPGRRAGVVSGTKKIVLRALDPTIWFDRKEPVSGKDTFRLTERGEINEDLQPETCTPVLDCSNGRRNFGHKGIDRLPGQAQSKSGL